MTPNFLDPSTNAVGPSRSNASRPALGAAKTQTSKADGEPTVRFGKVLFDLEKENGSLTSAGTATESRPSLDSPPELMQITLAMPNNATDSQETIETTNFQISGKLSGTLQPDGPVSQDLLVTDPSPAASVEIVTAPVENVLTTFMEVQPYHSTQPLTGSATSNLISQEATSALPSTFVSGLAAAIPNTGKSILNATAASALTGNQEASSQAPLGLPQDPRLVSNSSTHQLADPSTAAPSAADRSTADRSTADPSAADRSAADRSAADRSAADPSAADRSAADRSAADQLLTPENEPTPVHANVPNETQTAPTVSLSDVAQTTKNSLNATGATTSTTPNNNSLASTPISNPGMPTSAAQPAMPTDRGAATDSQASVSENQTNQAINLGIENSRPTPWVAGNTSDITTSTNPQGEVNVIPTVLRTIRNQNATNITEHTTGIESTTMEAASTSATPIQTGDATQVTRSSSFAGKAPGWQPSEQLSAFQPDAPTTPLSEYQTNEVTTADPNSFSQIEASLANLNRSRGPANRVPEHLVDLAPETLTKPILESVRRQLSRLGSPQADALDKGIKIELDPRELGSVTVEVKTIDNVTKIQIVADQPVAHALLEKNIEALLQSLDEGDGNTFDVDVWQRDSDAQSKGEQKRQRTQNASRNPNGNEPTTQSNPHPPDAPSEGGVNMVV